ncbi:MAG TPA: ComEA family DNA-binding protein [Gaiellaceae bacterium]|nr:ComEA family DNA-binding protein [Gaiellaceae bacterium]
MPEIEVSRGRALAAAGVLLLVLVFAGRYVLGAGAASSGRDATADVVAQPLHAEAAPPVVVHVVGAVRTPGLYRLGRGKRVADAVARAGGATGKADLALINLAAPVADGQQIVVPARAPPAAAAGGSTDGGGEQAAQGPVHLNSATIDELDELPGVGPVTAQKIVDYREKHGAFSSVRELDAIPGIGPARLAQLSELVAP